MTELSGFFFPCNFSLHCRRSRSFTLTMMSPYLMRPPINLENENRIKYKSKLRISNVFIMRVRFNYFFMNITKKKNQSAEYYLILLLNSIWWINIKSFGHKFLSNSNLKLNYMEVVSIWSMIDKKNIRMRFRKKINKKNISTQLIV